MSSHAGVQPGRQFVPACHKAGDLFPGVFGVEPWVCSVYPNEGMGRMACSDAIKDSVGKSGVLEGADARGVGPKRLPE